MPFVPEHNNAFLAMYLHRLRRLVSTQCDVLFDQHGIRAPSHATSVFLYLLERKRANITELADTLNYSHQLMNQRLVFLEERGLVERLPDPRDGRKVLFRLTRSGATEARRTAKVIPIAAEAIEDLFNEMGVNLREKAELACQLLEEKSIVHRASTIDTVGNGNDKA